VALHNDLLEQAFHLATREPKKPRQASLRRAVSVAYYALFHLLTYDAASLFPTTPAGLRPRIQRAFVHADMRSACASIISLNKASPQVQSSDATGKLLTFPLDPLMVLVLQSFIELQEARHAADYDFSKTYVRLDTVNQVEAAKEAFACWAKVRSSDNARVFLSAMLLRKSWGK
jgi:hypothetical protein